MSLFNKLFGNKKAAAPVRQAATTAAAQKPSPQSAAASQLVYSDGDKVRCGKCSRMLEVKYQRDAKFAVADPKVIQNWALRCQGCGFVCCHSCALGPSREGTTVCPSCKAAGGPYFFY